MAHKMLKPYSFLFYFLALVFSFFTGLLYAGFVDAGKNQGLAGGAIVLGYGVLGMFLGLLVALFVAYKAKRRYVFRLNIILALSILGFYAYYHIKYLERRKAKEKQNIENQHPNKKNPTKPISPNAEPTAMFVKRYILKKK